VVQDSFATATKTDRVGPPTFAAELPDGTVAVSFKATADQAVSDLIRPGDHVNFLVQVPNASVLGLADSGGAAMVHLFQDLTIIAIGDVPRPAPDAKEAPKNPGTGLYTVALSPQDSARLLLLAHEYDVYLTLVGPKTPPADIPPVADRDGLPSTPTTEPTATP
jgi:Flp pilus assembly protein CpaB